MVSLQPNMQVKSLKNINYPILMDCFNKAFHNYFVKLPTDTNFWKERWQQAKVDLSLSYGMFDKDRLIGFIINAIDQRNGELTAYNAGTGVLPQYRGEKIVKSIYDFALPNLKQNGITKCTLEVIKENEIAIKSYRSIGFVISKNYKSFKT